MIGQIHSTDCQTWTSSTSTGMFLIGNTINSTIANNRIHCDRTPKNAAGGEVDMRLFGLSTNEA